jgi:hypothetical protein
VGSKEQRVDGSKLYCAMVDVDEVKLFAVGVCVCVLC